MQLKLADPTNDFLTILLGGRLPETENKIMILIIHWPKRWLRSLKKIEERSLKRVFETIFDLETKWLFTKWSLTRSVAYKKWLLEES